ncbi:MAG: ATPase, partial [Curtobacterium sp.]
QKEYEKAQREFERAERAAESRRAGRSSTRTTASRKANDPLSDLLGSGLGRTIAKEVVQGIFSTLRRRR